MVGLNEYIETKIITHKGIINISEVNIGDKVYEYNTGKLLEVRGIKKSKDTEIFEVTFSDKRTSLRTHDEILPAGEIETKPLEFNHDKVVKPLYPDPYIAGALFIYGNHEDKYLSLPLDMDAANNEFANKYNLDYGNRLDHNIVYFSYSYTPNKLITWREFFKDYDFYAKTKKKSSPIIPNEYMYGSIKDRIQFIMGVFDLGYDKTRFPDFVAIQHWNEDMLKLVQKILWSLGVPSVVEYDPIYRDDERMIHKYLYNREYRLRILGDKSRWPGFFYDINKLEHFIIEDSWIKKLEPKWIFKVQSSKRYCHGFMNNIVLDKPSWYYTENYLPRLSL